MRMAVNRWKFVTRSWDYVFNVLRRKLRVGLH